LLDPLDVSFILGWRNRFPLLLVLLVFCTSGFPIPFLPECLGFELMPVALDVL
jgi:hypothetical protein